MNVAGGMGCQDGDLPVFISALRPDSVVARSGKVQVGLLCMLLELVCIGIFL